MKILIVKLNGLLTMIEAKKSIQEIVDMPNKQIDLFIKLVMQNNGKLSLRKANHYFSLLTKEEIKRLVVIVNEVMVNLKEKNSVLFNGVVV